MNTKHVTKSFLRMWLLSSLGEEEEEEDLPFFKCSLVFDDDVSKSGTELSCVVIVWLNGVVSFTKNDDEDDDDDDEMCWFELDFELSKFSLDSLLVDDFLAKLIFFQIMSKINLVLKNVKIKNSF